MTEVWKSTGRKFCELCKVWFGDNKASILHHESGMKHKAMIQQKLRDIGKSNAKKANDAAQLNATLAAMEAGAYASMERNGEGVANGPALPERGLAIGPRAPVGGSKYLDPREISMQSMTAEMERRRQEEEEKRREKERITKKSTLWRDDDPNEDMPLPNTDLSEIMWVETDAEDGSKYYYHMYSGATSWEVPDRFFTQKEYDRRLADIEKGALDRQKQGLPADPSQMTTVNKKGEEISVGPAIQVAKRKVARAQEEIEAAVKAAKYDADYGSASTFQAPATTAYGYGSQPVPAGNGPTYTSMPDLSGGITSGELPPAENKSRFTAMPERSGPSLYNAHNRKGRREYTKFHENEPSEMDIPMPADIPMPSSGTADAGGATSYSESSGSKYRCGPAATATPTAPSYPPHPPQPKMTREEQVAAAISAKPFKKVKDEEFKVEEEDEEDSKEDVAEEVLKLSASAAPFGGWTKVTRNPNEQPYIPPTDESQKKAMEKARAWREREDGVEANKAAIAAAIPVIEFTEKVAPMKTKKNAGPVEFKKKSAPKNVRRREEI